MCEIVWFLFFLICSNGFFWPKGLRTHFHFGSPERASKWEIMQRVVWGICFFNPVSSTQTAFPVHCSPHLVRRYYFTLLPVVLFFCFTLMRRIFIVITYGSYSFLMDYEMVVWYKCGRAHTHCNSIVINNRERFPSFNTQSKRETERASEREWNNSIYEIVIKMESLYECEFNADYLLKKMNLLHVYGAYIFALCWE